MTPTLCVRCHTTSLGSDLLEGLCLRQLIILIAKILLQQRRDMYPSERSHMHFPILPLPGPHEMCFLFGIELQGCVCDVSAQGSPVLFSGSEAFLWVAGHVGTSC